MTNEKKLASVLIEQKADGTFWFSVDGEKTTNGPFENIEAVEREVEVYFERLLTGITKDLLGL